MSDSTLGRATDAEVQNLETSIVKQCCAAAYDSDAARLLLGDSFHPGGTKLTERLGRILKLSPQTRLLDVAAGRGASALFLAQEFGCEVVGVDYSRKNIEAGNDEARASGFGGKVTFQWADAEKLPFPEASFDAIICECAFCTFPNKQAAASEFNRVLRPTGQIGLSDLTRDGVLAPELDSLMSWVACIADAHPLSDYVALLSNAAFTVTLTERHDGALVELVKQIQTRLLAAEVMVRLQKLVLPGLDLEAVKIVAKHALAAIRQGKLGYAFVVASKQAQVFSGEAAA
jgi:ubiquinone/menaquinone biosynthesis C-methylase UbiE